MRFKIKGLKNVVGANVAIVALLFLTLSAYAGSVPNVFTSGTVAKSSEVNDNFTYLGERSWDKTSDGNLYFANGIVGIGTTNPVKVHSKVLDIKTGTNKHLVFFSASEYGAGTQGVAINSVDDSQTVTQPLELEGVPVIFSHASGGPVGINTNNPQAMLHVIKSNGYVNYAAIFESGNVGIGTTSPSYPLHMGSGAYVTTGGVWTNASSREYKKDIQSLTSEDAMLAFNKLEPVSFKYKTDDEQHIGFIAEDVPDIVATKDRKGLSPMDMVALLTKVVQEQQKTVQEQQKTIAELSDRLKSLENQTK
ncbi:hypothetical protein MBAV_003540 [Candidatus Magnetobacterium bavaricum]|uniref:Peptidase S74 domain-containing protein n=1 Tax=Candidatus Magnetobacterium bavaricum TaxID=29290 RepID=A0A0F3GQT9_9BACT|nr:hypothetical protein MBAV_003540 [Candidatus Magnetobacterium bavaricum]